MVDKLQATLVQAGDQWVLNLMGIPKIDTYRSLGLIDISNELTWQQIQTVVIDLAGIQNLNSRGLQFLLNLHEAFLQQDIRMILQNPDPQLYRLLRIMQFDRVFVIE